MAGSLDHGQPPYPDKAFHSGRQVGKRTGWISNPAWKNPSDRLYDLSETGAVPVHESISKTDGNKKQVTFSNGSESSPTLTGPAARTKWGAKRAGQKMLTGMGHQAAFDALKGNK